MKYTGISIAIGLFFLALIATCVHLSRLFCVVVGLVMWIFAEKKSIS